MILPTRHSIRLKGYDYSSNGVYYVTICTQGQEMLFGNILNKEMVLNKMGEIVELIWESLPQHHPIDLGTFQIMPNHVHMIIMIVGATRGSPDKYGLQLEGRSRPAPTELGTIVGLFKSEITKRIRIIADNPKFIVWQRNYYEHIIIRSEQDLEKISWYIVNNPKIWERDRNNPGTKVR